MSGGQGGQVAGVAARLRRVAATPDGYALAVDLATTSPLADWHAEIVPPQGGTVTAGPGTTTTSQGQVVKLVPNAKGVTSGRASVFAAVTGTQQAPTHVRAQVTTSDGKTGSAQPGGVVVQDRRGALHKATDTTWPGSEKTVTNPDQWSHHGGGGGGGGGGGQFTCNLLVDLQNQTVSHQITSDAGGGGGAGGGSGSGGQQQGGEYDYKQQQKRNRG